MLMINKNVMLELRGARCLVELIPTPHPQALSFYSYTELGTSDFQERRALSEFLPESGM